MQDEQRYAQLVEDLTKPIYVYRMARSDKRKGAETRRLNALAEIKDIIWAFNEEKQYG